LLEKISHNKLLLIILHLVLGFIATILPIGKIYMLLIIITGIIIISITRNKNEEALYFLSYLVGAEIFIRMTDGAILYEIGKYGLILFSLLGIFLGPIKGKISISLLIYILLLSIGIIFTQVPLGESIRKAIAFNLSGPISLAVFALYCNLRNISIKQLKQLLFFLLSPIFSMIIFLYLKTPSLEDLVFTTSSNFATSGGFGPNQVSTMIGVGTFIIAIFIILRVQLSKYLFLDIIFLAYFTYRGLLTFSRGGMLTAGAALVAFIVCIVLHKRLTFKKLFLYTSVSFALFIGVWLYTTNITGGLISNRYAGTNAKGVQKKDVSAGRGAIFEAQLESFYESPFFGIGVGNGKYKRMETNVGITAAAHNEVSRLLEEQGILGFLALLILLFKPLVNIYFGTMYQRSFLISFYIFWFLTINHSAMRLAFPGFIYGLSLIKITTDDE
jgi:O-antigen ligase